MENPYYTHEERQKMQREYNKELRDLMIKIFSQQTHPIQSAQENGGG